MCDRFHAFFPELNIFGCPHPGGACGWAPPGWVNFQTVSAATVRGAHHPLTPSYTSFASSVMFVFPLNSREIGHPFFALFAAVSKLAAVAPGTFARVVR